ncbi:hypothetical protein CDD81_394 [Ophiocordyceps australis]|uniref:Endoplasmic reticulum lectin n=1 Tax=Ophiocordyceps australis TaxID=1399860 RepID=A0A2C5Y193_9HYPO|nr:hypothetical protein CDD81_394 [Ophiocordyceps australis]
MRHHLNFALLATLQLRRVGARTPGFSIHDDLLAFPQYEILFRPGHISSKEAEALLDNKSPHATYSAAFGQPTAQDYVDASSHHGPLTGQSYEMITLAPHRYLCSIPLTEPPSPENQTANALAAAEEALQLNRAAEKGWELLAGLQDSCLYFMSGWWSYSFCNNREIVQFHALAAVSSGQPPRRDPQTAEYVLGRVPTLPAAAQKRGESQVPPPPAELQAKGDQRYLVQRLEGGTICDLTGRERTVEVQYHCVPGAKGDRIGWIKEVTICAYVMVINTPRLCDDVAFLPPEETKANPISCQAVSDGDQDPSQPLLGHSPEPKQGSDSEGNQGEVTVGGVLVGARKVLSSADEEGKPPVKLAAPRIFGADDRIIEILVQAASKAEGGKVKMLTADELEKLEVKPEVVEEMRAKMEKLAGDAGWKLEVVELDGGEFRELRGFVDEAVGGHAENNKAKGAQKKEQEGQVDKDADEASDTTEGSQEKFYKEEL